MYQIIRIAFFILKLFPGSHNGKSRKIILCNRADFNPVSVMKFEIQRLNNKGDITIHLFGL